MSHVPLILAVRMTFTIALKTGDFKEVSKEDFEGDYSGILIFVLYSTQSLHFIIQFGEELDIEVNTSLYLFFA